MSCVARNVTRGLTLEFQSHLTGSRMKFPLFGFCISLLVALAPAHAYAEESGRLAVFFDNDWFDTRDRHYTSGALLAWTTAPARTPRWLEDTAHALPLFAENGEVRATYAIGQSM